MRLSRITCVLLCLSLAFLPSLSTPASVLTKTLRFALDDLKIRKTDSGFYTVRLKGAVGAAEEGTPDLPMVTAWFLVPEGSIAASARVTPVVWTEVPGSYRIGPVVPARFDQPSPVASEPRWSSSPSWLPGIVGHVSTGRFRGQKLAAVTIPAVQYLPSEGKLRLCTELSVELELAPDPNAGNAAETATPLRQTDLGRATTIATLAHLGLEAEAAEMEQVRSTELHPLSNSGVPFAPTFRPSVDGSPVDMVIITDDTQAPAYQELADFKTEIGVPTVVRTVSWIKANYLQELDTEATVRAFIRDAYEKWGTTFILLGGDTGVIPIRKAKTADPGGEVMATDFYYSTLDGNWDADGDGVFGEAYRDSLNPGDDVDLDPDVYVGRLPSANPTEAQRFVDKIFTYQKHPPTDFATKSLFLGEILVPQDNPSPPDTSVIGIDGAEICQNILASGFPLSFILDLTRMYENNSAWPGSINENKTAVISHLNSGYALTNFVGHGYINTMAVGADGGQLFNSDVEDLTNGARQGVLFALTCNAADVEANCIAEAWLRAAGGGAVAVISNSSPNYIQPETDYQEKWYHQLFVHDITNLGSATAEAKLQLAPYGNSPGYRCLLFNTLLLGDPELPMWTAEPDSFTLSHASTFALGAGSYSVTVHKAPGSTPVAGARVCLCKDGDAYSVGYTDANGEVSLPFRPDLGGTFTVGVWALNYKPKVNTCSVVTPGSTPYVFAQTQMIDDDTNGGSNGNDDGKIDAGETVELRIRLKNNGAAAAPNLTTSLFTTDSLVTISDNVSYYGTIAAGDSAMPTDQFVLTVASSTPDRYIAKCTLYIMYSSVVDSQQVLLYVHAPVFEYHLQAVRDTVGNGNSDGVIQANEDFAIRAYLENRGLGAARSLELHLRASDPAVTITDSVTVLGDVASGEVAVNPSDATRARFSNTSSLHKMQAVLVDAYGEVFHQTIDVQPPDTVATVIPTGSASSIKLIWDRVTDGDLWGYNIYRFTSSSGPFARVNQTNDRSATYRDEGLNPYTRYYYRVAAVDSSGNEGVASPVVSTTTTMPMHPGFPVAVGRASTAGITLVDLDKNGSLEILTGGEEVYALEPDGSEYINGDGDVRNLGPFSNTDQEEFWNTPAVGDVDGDGDNEVAAVSWRTSQLYVWDKDGEVHSGFPKALNITPFGEPNPLGSVALCDVDQDENLEIFVQCDTRLFAFHDDGTELLDGDSVSTTAGVFKVFGDHYNYSTPSFADLDGDHYPEVIATGRDGMLYAWKRDGTSLPDFPITLPGNMTSSPAIGDIDRDGRQEIVFGSSPASSAPGMVTPFSDGAGLVKAGPTPGGEAATPVRSRLQPLGSASVSPKIMVHLSAPVTKNKCTTGNISSCSQAVTQGVANPDTSYYAYVIASEYSSEYGLSGVSFGISYNAAAEEGVDIWEWHLCAFHDYQMANWPASGTGNRIIWDTGSSDPNTGCQHDAVAVAGYFYLTAYSQDYLSITTNPTSGTARVANCVGNEQVLASEDLGRAGFGQAGYNPCSQSLPAGGLLNAYRVDGTQVPGWPVSVPMSADVDASPALGDMNGDDVPDVVIGGSDGDIYAFNGKTGAALSGFPSTPFFPQGSPVEIRSSPVLADVNSDGHVEIFFGDQAGTVHGLPYTGNDQELEGFPIQTGNLIEGAPAVWDVDDDGLTELVVNSYDQTISMWDLPWTFNAQNAPWPMFKRSPRHEGNILQPVWGQTGVSDPTEAVGAAPILMQALPNPLVGAGSVTIRFNVPPTQSQHMVELRVFDISGCLVKTLVDGPLGDGQHEATWDGRCGDGRHAAPGVYLYRLRVDGVSLSRKLVIVR